MTQYEIITDGKFFALKKTEKHFLGIVTISFFNLKDRAHWHARESGFFPDCWTEDYGLAEMWLKRFRA